MICKCDEGFCAQMKRLLFSQKSLDFEHFGSQIFHFEVFTKNYIQNQIQLSLIKMYKKLKQQNLGI